MAIREGCTLVGNNADLLKMATLDLKFTEVSSVYEPKITFIAVQKRHKTRFFPNKASDGVGKVS